jgi:hypothetical protein
MISFYAVAIFQLMLIVCALYLVSVYRCGQRGGYMELSSGVAQGVKDQLYKMASISLCSNTSGQIMVTNYTTAHSP